MPTPRPRLLLTAFEPFGGRRTNRSQTLLEQAARALQRDAEVRLATRLLPVDFARLPGAVGRALTAFRGGPDALVMLGESGDAGSLRLERLAVNRIDARIPDNAGRQPAGVPVATPGPSAYLTSAKLPAALAAARREDPGAQISDHAGRFACNAAYYLALHLLREKGRAEVPVLFVHVPVSPRALALRPATRALLALLQTMLPHAAAPSSRAAAR